MHIPLIGRRGHRANRMHTLGNRPASGARLYRSVKGVSARRNARHYANRPFKHDDHASWGSRPHHFASAGASFAGLGAEKAWTWRVPPWTIIVVADVYAPHDRN
jgi:hypothetical protein